MIQNDACQIRSLVTRACAPLQVDGWVTALYAEAGLAPLAVEKLAKTATVVGGGGGEDEARCFVGLDVEC